jgi:hypothetical protein
MTTAIPILGFVAVLVWIYFQGTKARAKKDAESRLSAIVSGIPQPPAQSGAYGDNAPSQLGAQISGASRQQWN